MTPTATLTDHGDGLESMLIVGPDGRATLTTWLRSIEIETLAGVATDPDDPDTFVQEDQI